MSPLIEQLEAKAEALARRSIAEMYNDPFWQERFGARGRELAERDGQYHLSYLIQALAAGDPGVFTRYTRWLQTVLVSRGMSSRHIAQNFSRLARAVQGEIAEPGPALALLRAAEQALVYDAGPARQLQQLARPLARAVVSALERSHTAWFAAASSYASLASLESIEHAERVRFEDDVLDHLAYLADALHGGRPELFVQHAVWMKAFLVRRRAPPARVEQTLLALREALLSPAPELEVAPELAGPAAAALDAALEVLHEPRASATPGARPE